ncbi:MAG: cytochrome C [Rhodocyclaceae bacterium]|jgi:nitrate/TMAO reductase-like tetraheme cytochrome c subunit|nr:cytochrome C [Rhodocyclaceae bacterium]
MKKALLLILLFPFAATSAIADKLRLPADAPPAFQAECGSCHAAFPPQLMIADDWRRVMRSLDKHYGDNASLDEKTRLILEDFHVRNAGNARKVGAGRTARAGEPPRLTQTDWFQREHRKVSAADWKDAKVKTPANCAACHTQAAEGSYREREIVMPDGRRWKD